MRSKAHLPTEYILQKRCPNLFSLSYLPNQTGGRGQKSPFLIVEKAALFALIIMRFHMPKSFIFILAAGKAWGCTKFRTESSLAPPATGIGWYKSPRKTQPNLHFPFVCIRVAYLQGVPRPCRMSMGERTRARVALYFFPFACMESRRAREG